jgi:p-hydroxybenzoate 3-monooxygenase
VEFKANGKIERVECDFIAGCDGFHGVSRASVPPEAIKLTNGEHVVVRVLAGAPASFTSDLDRLVIREYPAGARFERETTYKPTS